MPPSPSPRISTVPIIDDSLGRVLLSQARLAIGSALAQPAPAALDDQRLSERGATFVTLTLDGELRGCIGSLNAHRPLGEDVRDNAVAAALRDSRFAPLSAAEFKHVRVEVSLLTEPDFIDFKNEADALAQLEPGRDGVILFNGCQKATFLPQVWEQLPDRRAFMAALKQKARLPVDFWSPNIMIARYQVNKWKEPDTPE
ncbi:MAG: AmmeMemoRadiSam system protein A [Zoogloea sp.]|nr:AmmeMemoRadiSam system protein A [Zoogloea sp.]